MTDARFLFAGGGTGGHIFPLVAVAQALRALQPSVDVVYVGTSRGLESKILGDLKERLLLLPILPIKGGGFQGAVRGVSRALCALPAALRLVRQVRPSVVLSIGGYAAGPVSLAARCLGIPLALLEPNSILGLANRIMAPLAHRAYLAFPELEPKFRASVAKRVGVPLRQGFSPQPYTPHDGPLHVLVLGGSQGAVTLNENVPDALGLAKHSGGLSFEVLHQTGGSALDEVRDRYESAGIAERAKVVPFIDDVPRAIADADLVVQRAGASAVAEVCAIGRASIYVPYPFAAGNHQLHNARALEAAGAAVCIPSDEASPNRLARELLTLAQSPDRRTQMASIAMARGRPDASITIAQDLLVLAEVS